MGQQALNFTSIQLDPLGIDAADELVRSLLGNTGENAELRALIVERTEGTPLFIEETITTLVESGALRRRSAGYELTRKSGKSEFRKRCSR